MRPSHRNFGEVDGLKDTVLMPTVYQRAAARRDLVEQFIYLEEQTGLDRAENKRLPACAKKC